MKPIIFYVIINNFEMILKFKLYWSDYKLYWSDYK